MDDGRRDEEGRLAEVLDELAGRTGLPVGEADADVGGADDHWPLYEAALADPANHALLFEAVWFEPDQNVALSVVLRVLGGLPEDEQARWVAQLRWEYAREYARRSAHGALR
ncbi:hypothetical protein [Streptomyces sp. NPDC021224]|uniref:hypothetical protein n=1 Tax=unclassified Streptomyces TaxID=2593676 RepID=UPI0037A6736A